jgi:hypothetical protein
MTRVYVYDPNNSLGAETLSTDALSLLTASCAYYHNGLHKSDTAKTWLAQNKKAAALHPRLHRLALHRIRDPSFMDTNKGRSLIFYQ